MVTIRLESQENAQTTSCNQPAISTKLLLDAKTDRPRAVAVTDFLGRGSSKFAIAGPKVIDREGIARRIGERAKEKAKTNLHFEE
jgi:hypothetical protein